MKIIQYNHRKLKGKHREMQELDVRMRILSARLIEQMNRKPAYAGKLGLDNTSVFCGERKNEEKEQALVFKGGLQK